MLFILAQICGIIALILVVISVQFKTKEKIVMYMVFANFMIAIQFFLLNAITGAIISIINTIRCIVFYYYKKKEMKPSFVTLLIFEIIAIVSGIISWQNIWSLIPIIVTVLYTYGLWQDNVKVLRIMVGIVGGGWAIYDVVVKAYVGALQEVSQLISAIVSLVRNHYQYLEKEVKTK